MKVNLIKIRSVQEYIKNNPESQKPMDNFLQLIKKANWNTIEDMQVYFKNCSIVCSGERVVFRIGGKKYRMICGFQIKTNRKRFNLYIKFIGTHAKYSKLNKAKKGEIGICEVSDY